MKKITTMRYAVLLCLLTMTSSLWAHSTNGFFVTNGIECYFVFTNWHGGPGEQQGSINGNDGVFIDLNQDDFFNGNLSTASAPSPLSGNTDEFVMFTDYIDITDGATSPSTTLMTDGTWKGEIENWFNNGDGNGGNIGSGFVASLIWNPGCSSSSATRWALVAKMDACPTVNDLYTAAVAAGSQVSTPCGSGNAVFQLDFMDIDFTPNVEELPAFSARKAGLLLFMVIGVSMFLLYRKF